MPELQANWHEECRESIIFLQHKVGRRTSIILFHTQDKSWALPQWTKLIKKQKRYKNPQQMKGF